MGRAPAEGLGVNLHLEVNMGRVIAANRAERGHLLLFLLVAYWACGGS